MKLRIVAFMKNDECVLFLQTKYLHLSFNSLKLVIIRVQRWKQALYIITEPKRKQDLTFFKVKLYIKKKAKEKREKEKREQ